MSIFDSNLQKVMQEENHEIIKLKDKSIHILFIIKGIRKTIPG